MNISCNGTFSVIWSVPQGCLRFVIVVFPDHTHLLFKIKSIIDVPICLRFVAKLTLDDLADGLIPFL